LVFLVGVGYVAIIAFNTGNPEYLVYPFDSSRNQCGFSPGYQDYPYIFIGEYNLSITYVCTKQCPLNDTSSIDCKINGVVTDCSLLKSYATQTIVTYCLPLNETQIIVDQIVSEVLSVGVLQKYFADLYVSWKLILAMVGVSLVVSILYSLLIRAFAGVMVWIMILFLMLISLVVGLVTLFLPSSPLLQNILNYDNLPDTFKDRTYQIVVGIVNITIFLVTFLICCCMRR
jgi:uncharacterized membrane protein YagU involved in acid resistance